jgi:nitroreductase
MDLTTIDHLLTTTRSVRKRLDFTRPVDLAVVARCLEIAMQAPTGGNQQGWHFMVVTDAEKRRQLGELYRQAFAIYRAMDRPPLPEDDPRRAQLPRVIASADYLAQHLHEAPVHVIPCIEGRVEQLPVAAQAATYGSIMPAAWSFMLALRSRGLGTAWTSLHLFHEREAAAILGIPEIITQVALFPVAHYTGTDFKPAKRLPAASRIYWDRWGARRDG